MESIASQTGLPESGSQHIKTRFSTRRTCVASWSFVLGGMLLFTGLTKAHDPVQTQRVLAAWLEHTASVDGRAGAWAVRVLVLVEVVLGAWLISGIRNRAALVAGGSLILGFTVWLVSAREVVQELGCGCSLPSWLGTGFGLVLARNLVLLGITVLGVLFAGRPERIALTRT